MTKAHKPRPLIPQQITAIYEAIGSQYKLGFLLMADAGIRSAEAMTLTREQVEFDTGVIFARGKGSKNESSPSQLTGF